MLKGLEYVIGNTEDLRAEIIRYTRLLRRLDERIEFHLVCLQYITEEREDEMLALKSARLSSSCNEGLNAEDHLGSGMRSKRARRAQARGSLSEMELTRSFHENEEISCSSTKCKTESSDSGLPMRRHQRRRLEDPRGKLEDTRKRKEMKIRDNPGECREGLQDSAVLRRRLHLRSIDAALRESVDVVHPSWLDTAILSVQVPPVREISDNCMDWEMDREKKKSWIPAEMEPIQTPEGWGSFSRVGNSSSFGSSKNGENKHESTQEEIRIQRNHNTSLELMFKPHEMLVHRFLEEKSWLSKELVEISKELHHTVFQKWTSLSSGCSP